ncbi:MAG TPA: hypothetical protein VGN98_10230 [Tianweitania sediminis]|jgi:hypothetical protein|nr:hypothetical protein [Tianweitania sediminis]
MHHDFRLRLVHADARIGLANGDIGLRHLNLNGCGILLDNNIGAAGLLTLSHLLINTIKRSACTLCVLLFKGKYGCSQWLNENHKRLILLILCLLLDVALGLLKNLTAAVHIVGVECFAGLPNLLLNLAVSSVLLASAISLSCRSGLCPRGGLLLRKRASRRKSSGSHQSCNIHRFHGISLHSIDLIWMIDAVTVCQPPPLPNNCRRLLFPNYFIS